MLRFATAPPSAPAAASSPPPPTAAGATDTAAPPKLEGGEQSVTNGAAGAGAAGSAAGVAGAGEAGDLEEEDGRAVEVFVGAALNPSGVLHRELHAAAAHRRTAFGSLFFTRSDAHTTCGSGERETQTDR